MSGMCELVEIGCLTSGDARRNVRGDQCDLSRGNIDKRGNSRYIEYFVIIPWPYAKRPGNDMI